MSYTEMVERIAEAIRKDLIPPHQTHACVWCRDLGIVPCVHDPEEEE